MKRIAGILSALVVFLSFFQGRAGEAGRPGGMAGGLLAQADSPIVAVFDVEAKRVELPKDMLDALADYLASRLTETGKYQVVPRDQIRERLVEQKKRSYKTCYDQKCQIELGRELAAEKTVATQVGKFGDVCTLSVTLYDLRKAATESAATERGPCDEKGLLGSLDKVVDKLVGAAGRAQVGETGAQDKMTEKAGLEVGGEEIIDGIVWVSIPGGTFWMGCSPGDKECDSDEKPRHQEMVKSFKLMKYEFTQGQYKKVMGSNPSFFSNCGDDCPVEKVDWYQAREFCRKVGGRLPTEIEWEYAARAGTEGARYGDLDSVAWYVRNSGRRTHPVGKKTANPWGLYDMLGNVWEWTESCWSENYNSSSDCSERVLRGGSWHDYVRRVRASSRGRLAPTFRSLDIGFRCARD